jgi:hypothetical protein
MGNNHGTDGKQSLQVHFLDNVNEEQRKIEHQAEM